MKKLFTLMAAASALAAAVPAAAQYDARANVNAGAGISNRIAQLDARLQAGVQSGAITRQEAQSLRPQLRQLRQLERQYSRDGLSQQERMELQQRLRTVRQQLRVADGGNARYDQYDRNDQYGEYDTGSYGQGAPYQQEVCESRGGLGGVIDNVLGRENCGGFQVGQRVSGNLYAVPYEYQNRYRDGNGVYYRSDGRSIYQIDARTNTVVRVYGMNR